MIEMSERQAQVMQFIRAFKSKTGYSPTYREIAANMGIRSTNGVKKHIEALENKGYIETIKYGRRAIGIKEEER